MPSIRRGRRDRDGPDACPPSRQRLVPVDPGRRSYAVAGSAWRPATSPWLVARSRARRDLVPLPMIIAPRPPATGARRQSPRSTKRVAPVDPRRRRVVGRPALARAVRSCTVTAGSCAAAACAGVLANPRFSPLRLQRDLRLARGAGPEAQLLHAVLRERLVGVREAARRSPPARLAAARAAGRDAEARHDARHRRRSGRRRRACSSVSPLTGSPKSPTSVAAPRPLPLQLIARVGRRVLDRELRLPGTVVA